MRLSEAINLGRHFVQPCAPNMVRPSEGYGCALDMAVKVVGDGTWQRASAYWPWLNYQQAQVPINWKVESLFWHIAFKFDRHVMGYKGYGRPLGKPTMNLDQFIDWVRSVEPPEPEQQEVKEGTECSTLTTT